MILASFAVCWALLAFFDAARQSRRSFEMAGVGASTAWTATVTGIGHHLSFLNSYLIHDESFLRDSVCNLSSCEY